MDLRKIFRRNNAVSMNLHGTTRDSTTIVRRQPRDDWYNLAIKFADTETLSDAVRILRMLPHPTEWTWAVTTDFGIALIHDSADSTRIVVAIKRCDLSIYFEKKTTSGYHPMTVWSWDNSLSWRDLPDRDVADKLQPMVLGMFPEP